MYNDKTSSFEKLLEKIGLSQCTQEIFRFFQPKSLKTLKRYIPAYFKRDFS